MKSILYCSLFKQIEFIHLNCQYLKLPDIFSSLSKFEKMVSSI